MSRIVESNGIGGPEQSKSDKMVINCSPGHLSPFCALQRDLKQRDCHQQTCRCEIYSSENVFVTFICISAVYCNDSCKEKTA